MTVLWDRAFISISPDEARKAVLATGAAMGFTVIEQTESTIRFKGRRYFWERVTWEMTIAPTDGGSTVHISVRERTTLRRRLQRLLDEFMSALEATLGVGAPETAPPPAPP